MVLAATYDDVSPAMLGGKATTLRLGEGLYTSHISILTEDLMAAGRARSTSACRSAETIWEVHL